ncbi:MAG: ribonuclease H-like domain-containing protein [Opitutales bacterium]|nr:ribonuclease H-like domain-containing protein [Opitutales bacterium]
MKPIIFDIETGPLPRTEIAQFEPEFEAPSNWKDPHKIKECIQSKQAEWYEKCALSATTGKVLAIGWMYPDEEPQVLCSGDEATDIRTFWDLITYHGAVVSKLVGFNSNSFDLPFLARRSWKLGVRPPAVLMSGRYLCKQCIDILDLWRCGVTSDRISLDNLSKYLGIGAKNGHGALFAQMLKEDPEQALRYLKNDVQLTFKCARSMGIV